MDLVFHEGFQAAEFRAFARLFDFAGEGRHGRVRQPMDHSTLPFVILAGKIEGMASSSSNRATYEDLIALLGFDFRAIQDVIIQPVLVEESRSNEVEDNLVSSPGRVPCSCRRFSLRRTTGPRHLILIGRLEEQQNVPFESKLKQR